jgi:hypothetical protein
MRSGNCPLKVASFEEKHFQISNKHELVKTTKQSLACNCHSDTTNCPRKHKMAG